MTDNADLRAAAEAATPGPWRLADSKDAVIGPRHHFGYTTAGPDSDYIAYSEDAAYIALASPDRILGILDDVERKTAALEGLVAERIEERADDYGRDEESWGPMLSDAERSARAVLEGKPRMSERDYADEATEPCGACPHAKIAHGWRRDPEQIPAGRCHSTDCMCPQYEPAPLDEAGLARAALEGKP